MATSPAGERRQVSGTARNMTAAREAVRTAKAAIEREHRPPVRGLTLSDLLSEYIAGRRGKIKAESTARDYAYTANKYIRPSVGQLAAGKVSAGRLRAYYAELEASGLGYRTREKIHGLLRAAYAWGNAEGLVTVNPTAHARPQRPTVEGAPRLHAFTPEQAAQFYRAARADRWGWPLAFALATGMRPGEVLGLRWDDVTFTPDGGARVRVERTRSVSGGKVYESTPKTERGRRALSLAGDAVKLLRLSQAQTEKESGARLRDGGREYQHTGYVFVTRAGTPYRLDNLRRPMGRICRAAGVPVLTPHKLRHTYASVMAASGVSVEVLSKRLGHKDPNVTRGIYRHVYDGEGEGLTFDPVTPAPQPEAQGRRRVKVRSRPVGVEGGSTPDQP
ncbi:tyrosine-type recombinase/integrase [Deinococcus murrayi]|uniref:tyrosine-type recombinase/integrase n=1 Tax=Deinococcus murrayi TaxID=68910 RepID=UPI00146F9829|nr:site-specific integrase [Deinococcus murrayi]